MADNTTGGSGATLESALEQFKQVMPAIKMIMDSFEEKKDEDKEKADKEAADKAAADAAEEEKKKDDEKAAADKAALDAKAKDEKADEDKEKKSEGMDAAITFKSLVGQIASRDALAKQLSAHVGAFDAADMTESEVVSYGIKKLGIKAPAGQEFGALSGYMLGKGDPAKKPTAKVDAMDSTPSANFVTRHLSKGE